jgi:cysteinyl-tRNA synthetase
MHNGLLQFSGEKMSKSIGNLISIEDLLARGDAVPFRLMVLQSIYRNPLVYTDEPLEAARRGVERLATAARGYQPGEHAASPEATATLADAEARFRSAMDDDFNTPVATAVLFDLARAANRAAGADQQALQGHLLRLAGVLGLRLDDVPASGGDAAPFIELLVQLRQELRDAKQWTLADGVRDRLEALGVTIEDTPTGTTWRARA